MAENLLVEGYCHPNILISTSYHVEQEGNILHNPKSKPLLDRLLRHRSAEYHVNSDQHTPSFAGKRQFCEFQAAFAHMNRYFAISDRTRPDKVDHTD